MTHRERFLNCLLGEHVEGGLPYLLYWAPWASTLRRWQAEAGFDESFDYRHWLGADPRPQAVNLNLGPCPQIPRTVIEEDEQYVTFIDGWGITRRDYKRAEAMSQFLHHPVADQRQWIEFRDRYLRPDHPRRLAGDWIEESQRCMREGHVIQLGNYPDCTIFGGLRWLMGDEQCLAAFYEMPQLVRQITTHLADVFLAVFEQVVRHVRVDVIHIWEDFAGRNGPLFSPAHFDQFVAPCYRRIRDFARRHGIPLISVDTDGHPELLLRPMQSAGVNFIFPLEVAAGCDVNEMQQRHPKLGMLGGIDKRALARGRDAIDAELRRVRPAIERGRYIPDLDHLVPDDVAWDDFVYFARRLKQLVGRE
jgi:uroporphyrinogen decarboxylase